MSDTTNKPEQQGPTPLPIAEPPKEPEAASGPTTDKPVTVDVINHGARRVSWHPSKKADVRGFSLAPGVNAVPANAWEVAKKDELIAGLLLQGERDGGLSVGGASGDLDRVDELSAYIKINASTDAEQLAAWEKTETRPRLLAAITEARRRLADAAAKTAARAARK